MSGAGFTRKHGCPWRPGRRGGCARRRDSGRRGSPRPPARLPVVKEPGDITVLVAGGDLAIPQLAYFPSWGFPPCRITREIAPSDHLIG